MQGHRLDRLLVAHDPHRQCADGVADEPHELGARALGGEGRGDGEERVARSDRVDDLPGEGRNGRRSPVLPAQQRPVLAAGDREGAGVESAREVVDHVLE